MALRRRDGSPRRVARQGRCAGRPGGYNAGPFIPPTWISWASGALSGEEKKAKGDRRCCAGWAASARRSPLRSSFCCPLSPCRRRLSPLQARLPRGPQRSWTRRRPSGAVPPSASPAALLPMRASKLPTSSIPARYAGPCSRRQASCRRACRPCLWRRHPVWLKAAIPDDDLVLRRDLSPTQPRGPPLV